MSKLLSLLALVTTFASSAAGKVNDRSRLELIQVRDLSYVGSDLSLTAIIPCDAKPLGVYLNHQSQANMLGVGFLVQRHDAVCAGLPHLHQETSRGYRFR